MCGCGEVLELFCFVRRRLVMRKKEFLSTIHIINRLCNL